MDAAYRRILLEQGVPEDEIDTIYGHNPTGEGADDGDETEAPPDKSEMMAEASAMVWRNRHMTLETFRSVARVDRAAALELQEVYREAARRSGYSTPRYLADAGKEGRVSKGEAMARMEAIADRLCQMEHHMSLKAYRRQAAAGDKAAQVDLQALWKRAFNIVQGEDRGRKG